MKRWAAIALIATGCIHVDRDTRVERGPLLRRFERPVIAEGGLVGAIEVRWPAVRVTTSQFDRCVTESVEEYAEEKVTERRAAAAGPSLTMGITTTLLGAGLIAARPLFSGEPNTQIIDASGRYGASTRQLATGWGTGLLIVGAPALVVGIVQYAQSGQEVQLSRAEQVAGTREARCNVRPIDGTVELAPPTDPHRPTTAATRDGVATFPVEALRAVDVERVLLNARPLELSIEDLAKLQAVRSCFVAEPPAEPHRLSIDGLVEKVRAARECRQMPGGPGEAHLALLNAEVERRRKTQDVPLLPDPPPR